MMKQLSGTACLAILLLAGAAQARDNPWFGTWKLRLKDASEKPETLIYSDAGGGAMRMVSVEQQSMIVTRFNGKPAPNEGVKAKNGNSLAVKATSPTSYVWTFFMAGKPFVRGKNTLAPDRKTFSEVSWLISKPSDVVTLVYEKL